MQASIKAIIRSRRSVRFFGGRARNDEDSAALEAYLAQLQKSFGVPVLLSIAKQTVDFSYKYSDF